jgi:hypothetical protein
MLGNNWLKNVSAPGFERGQSARLVALHQPAVADYIGGEDGRKPALRRLF